MSTVDTLLVRIEADMTDLKRSLEKVQRDVDKSSRGIGASFRRIGTAMKAALAAVVVQQAARAGAAFIGLASDIEEMQGKSKVVFGAFRDQVVADLEEFGNQVGRATHELEGMASSIQDTFVPMGFARGEAAKLSVELTKLAVDVASFNNASDTETMEAFQSALVGNHETVRRFGVVITEATLNQELMNMGIAKGTKEATNAEKVQARLNIIIKGTSDAHGDAARTSDSFANRMRALKAEFSELAGELATIFLPAVTKVVTALLQGTRAVREFLQSINVLATPAAQELEQVSEQIQNIEDQIEKARKGAVPTDSDSPYAAYAGAGEFDVAAERAENLQAKLDELIARRAELTLQLTPDGDGGAAEEETKEILRGFEALDKKTKKMLEENMLASMKLELERKLTEAEKSGNKRKIDAANLALKKFDADKKLLDVTDEMLEKEYNLTSVQYAGLNIKDALALKSAALATAMEKEGATQAANTKALGEYLDRQKELAEMTPLQDTYLQSLQAMSSGISNALADMVTSGKFSMDSMRDLFRSFVKTMIAKAVELFIVNKILGSVFGVPTTTLPTGATVLGKVATGGTVQANKPYIVGERGPELIVPSSASTVMNGHNTRSALKGGGGTVVNQTINISAGVAQTVKAEMLSMLPQIKADTMRSVADANMRGGSYRRALA